MVRSERFDLCDPHRTHAGRVNSTDLVISALGESLSEIVKQSNHLIV